MLAAMTTRQDAHEGTDEPSVPEPRGEPPRWRHGLARVVRWWLRLDVEGTEHVPATGPVILASSHMSHADPLAIGASIRRMVTFLGTSTLERDAVRSFVLHQLGLIPIDRGTGDFRVLEQVAAFIRDGHAIAVFPEGTRSRSELVHRPRSGVARLAALTGAPVVPMGIDGTTAAWPVEADGQEWRRPRRPEVGVRLRIGPPLQLSEDTGRARRAFNDELHDVLVELSGRPRSDDFAPVGNDRVDGGRP